MPSNASEPHQELGEGCCTGVVHAPLCCDLVVDLSRSRVAQALLLFLGWFPLFLPLLPIYSSYVDEQCRASDPTVPLAWLVLCCNYALAHRNWVYAGAIICIGWCVWEAAIVISCFSNSDEAGEFAGGLSLCYLLAVLVVTYNMVRSASAVHSGVERAESVASFRRRMLEEVPVRLQLAVVLSMATLCYLTAILLVWLSDALKLIRATNLDDYDPDSRALISRTLELSDALTVASIVAVAVAFLNAMFWNGASIVLYQRAIHNSVAELDLGDPPSSGSPANSADELELGDQHGRQENADNDRDGRTDSVSNATNGLAVKYQKSTFALAPFYISYHIGSFLCGFGLSILVLSVVVFAFRYPPTRSFAWTTVGSLLANFLFRVCVQRVCLGSFLTNQTTIKHPRLFACTDVFYGLTVGAATGAVSAVSRLLIGVLYVATVGIFRLDVPLAGMPPRWDLGRKTWGSMVRSRFGLPDATLHAYGIVPRDESEGPMLEMPVL